MTDLSLSRAAPNQHGAARPGGLRKRNVPDSGGRVNAAPGESGAGNREQRMATAAASKTIREEYESEVQYRVDTKADDPAWVEDNPGADARREALEDIIDMGTDCGGHFEIGILPTMMMADGRTVDRAAMARQAAWLADMLKQRARWIGIRRMAMAELKRLG